MKNEIVKENNKVVVNPPLTTASVTQPSGMLVGIIIGVLLCSTTVLGYTVISKARKTEEKPVAVMPTVEPTLIPSPMETVVAESSKVPGQFGTINWLPEPKKVDKLDVFDKSWKADPNNGMVYHPDGTRFFQTASFSSGAKLFNLFIPAEGMGAYDVLVRVVEVQRENKFYFLEMNKYASWKELRPLFNNTVTVSDYRVNELNSPEELTTNKGNLKKIGEIAKTYDSLKEPKLIAPTDYGGLYAVYTAYTEIPDLKARDFFLKLRDTTLVPYSWRYDFMSDEGVAWVRWKDGIENRTQFEIGFRGGPVAGSNYYVMDKDPRVYFGITDTGQTLRGKTSDPVYMINDINNPILKKIYQDYKVGRDYPSSPPIISKEEFLNRKTHFLWDDPLNDVVIFINSEYTMMAEMGKPVIYLYPEKEMMVNVQVGAEIRVSEPEYPPAGGWTVLARPNGELVYEGQKYPFLFWEGLGKGIYPDYQDRGMVVSQSKLVETVKSQLGQLGLNEKETADFMGFWQERLPKSPYVRLTWLMTEEMDKLAPLMVRPRPESYIRAFLEFEGLEKPIKLAPQKLVAPERKGFTLVEWGGLLVKER